MPKGNPTPTIELVLRRIMVDEHGCWVFQGALRKGYGVVGIWDPARQGTKTLATHRVTYEHFKGPIPDGLEPDHLCRNKACCNPAHLEAVTRRENLVRGETIIATQVRQTHCKRGHELIPSNLWRTKSGARNCKICRSLDERLKRRGQRIPDLGTWVAR